MKNLTTLLCLVFCCFQTPIIAQTVDCSTAKRADEVFQVVESMPRFSGCEHITELNDRKQCAQSNLMKYIGDNFQYPEAAKASNIEGTVVVRIIVNHQGCPIDTRIVRSLSDEVDQEVIRIMKQMPRWIPGKQRDKTVDVYFNIPVKVRPYKEVKKKKKNKRKRS